MARSCLLAAICASAKRSIRNVSAFQTNPFATQGFAKKSNNNNVNQGFFGVSSFQSQSNLSSTSSLLTRRHMSTTESSTDVVIKRVKTAEASASEDIVAVKGWVRTVRKQKTLAFVEVNDGSSLAGIQCVLPFDEIDEASNDGEERFTTNSFSKKITYNFFLRHSFVCTIRN